MTVLSSWKKKKKKKKKEEEEENKQTNNNKQRRVLHEVYSAQRDMAYLCQLRSAPTGEFLREVSSALRDVQFCCVHTGEFYMMYLVHNEPCFMPVMWFTNRRVLREVYCAQRDLIVYQGHIFSACTFSKQ